MHSLMAVVRIAVVFVADNAKINILILTTIAVAFVTTCTALCAMTRTTLFTTSSAFIDVTAPLALLSGAYWTLRRHRTSITIARIANNAFDAASHSARGALYKIISSIVTANTEILAAFGTFPDTLFTRIILALLCFSLYSYTSLTRLKIRPELDYIVIVTKPWWIWRIRYRWTKYNSP